MYKIQYDIALYEKYCTNLKTYRGVFYCIFFFFAFSSEILEDILLNFLDLKKERRFCELSHVLR